MFIMDRAGRLQMGILIIIVLLVLSFHPSNSDATEAEIYYGAFVNFTFDADLQDNTTNQVLIFHTITQVFS